MGVRDFRTDFPWFSGLLRYLPARWVTSKWFIADFPGCRLSAWVRRYQLERFSTSFVWGYPKPFHFFGWFIILCMAAWTTSWFLAGFFWVSENGAGADVGRGVYFNTYFNHGILKQVADFQINLFQTYFKPISDLFQTYFRPISNLFQTYFKPILNLFQHHPHPHPHPHPYHPYHPLDTKYILRPFFFCLTGCWAPNIPGPALGEGVQKGARSPAELNVEAEFVLVDYIIVIYII